MKKIVVLCFVFCLFFACSLHGNLLTNLTSFDADAKVCFYCGDVQDVENATTQKNGNGAILTCTAENASDVYRNITSCFGYSIKYDDMSVLEGVLAQIKVLKTQIVEGITSYFGVARGAIFFDFLHGQKINIQVAVCDGYFVVGSPIILGSY